MGESPGRHRDCRHCRTNMSFDLTPLAPEARSGQISYVMSCQRNQPPRGTDAGVRSFMKQIKELTSELERKQRAERSSRVVIQERLVSKGNRNQVERG